MLLSPAALSLPRRSLLTRRRFALAGAALLVPLLPYLLRRLFLFEGATFDTMETSLWANLIAVMIDFWIRISVQTYPGTRAGAVILPSIGTAHSLVLAGLLLMRLPYDRLAILLGFLIHLMWAFALYFVVQRRFRPRIAVVPAGDIAMLERIDNVDWFAMTEPTLEAARGCDAIVADFDALSDDWEALLADAAIDGRIVYQVKQLHESMTGRVRVDHLSENSFGSLVPMRGYAHIKHLADWLFAVLILPLVVPLMLGIALAIRLDSRGPALFRQRRVGQGGALITVFKFRTMTIDDDPADEGRDQRDAAMTDADDPRITRVGRWLRRTRLDELPQMINILKGQMSWIGPRPEAAVLSSWYSGDIPFYRYRHVVRPGISGWAQVKQGHVAAVGEVHEKLQYDFFYIKYFSPWLDLLILFKTARTMLTGFGSK